MLEACEKAVAEMEEEMLSGLDLKTRDALYDGLMTAVRGLHAGFPR